MFDGCSYFAFNKKDLEQLRIILVFLGLKTESLAQITGNFDKLENIIETLKLVDSFILDENDYAIFVSIF